MRRLERAVWALAVIWCSLVFWPASHWYEAGDMWVSDFTEGEQMILRYSGGAQREFKGSYTVVIRRPLGNEVVTEDRSGIFNYHPNSVRPDPLTIEWWAPGDERAHNLPPGEYQMKTCWTIHGAFWGLVPSKTTCVKSNIFEVLPGGE